MISQNTYVLQIQLIISTSYFETAQQISEISRSDKKMQNTQPDINRLIFLSSMRRNKPRVIFVSLKIDSIAPVFAQVSDFYLYTQTEIHVLQGRPQLLTSLFPGDSSGCKAARTGQMKTTWLQQSLVLGST